MVLTMFPISAMAEEVDASIGMSGEIIAFAPLAEAEKSVPTGKAIEDLEFPETLTATVRTSVAPDSGTAEEPVQDSGNPDNLTEATSSAALQVDVNEQQEAAAPKWKEKTVDIPVTWTADPEYNPNENGDYVFKPVIEGYTVSTDLPEITVTVGTQPLMMALRTGAPVTYGIWVGNTEVTSENKDGVTGDGITGNVTYDVETNTLTLDNASITSLCPPGMGNGQNGNNFGNCGGIFRNGDLNIALIGGNTVDISSVSGQYRPCGIYILEGAVKITGSEATDSLTVISAPTTQFSHGISGKGVTIEGCAVTATGGDSSGSSNNGCDGIQTTSLTVKDAVVTANGGHSGTTGTASSYGILAENGVITISDSTVTAKGNTKALYFRGTVNATGLTATAAMNKTGEDATILDFGESVYSQSNSYKYVQIAPATGSSPEYGDFAVTGSDLSGANWSNKVLTISKAGDYTIGMANGTNSTDNTIKVTSVASITLNGVNIDVSSTENAAAFKITDTAGAVNLCLANGSVNTLKSGSKCAGLQKDTTAEDTMLTIYGTGTLNATGGNYGAGIGGTAAATGGGAAGSYITISGGTVTATGGSYGAGIGGGGNSSGITNIYSGGSGSHITISGGTVTANGGYWSAGIGGGSGGNQRPGGNGNYITISGGTVTATGGQAAAGIGAGTGQSGGTTENIVITGGNIVTNSIWNTPMNANGDNVYKTTFTVPNDATGATDVSTMTFTSGGTAYTYNMTDAKSILNSDAGKVYVYLPGDSAGIAATASYGGKKYAANVKDDGAAVFAYALPTAAEYAADASSSTDYSVSATTITIKTAKGAAWWSASIMPLYYTILLADDIDVSDFLWSPVGDGSSGFAGIFDGQGHSISGLNVNVRDYNYAGLFGRTYNATIKNLCLSGSVTINNSSGGSYGGPFVGQAGKTTIINCCSHTDVTATSSDAAAAGGIVGIADVTTSITNCFNTGRIYATASNGYSYAYAGGIAGDNNTGSISNCYSIGSVQAENASNRYAGGVVGRSVNGNIKNCYYLIDKSVKGIGTTVYSPVITSCGTFDYYGRLTAGTAAQFVTEQTLASYADGKELIEALNGWVNSVENVDHNTWQADAVSHTSYPIFDVKWAAAHAHCVCGSSVNGGDHTDHSTIIPYTKLTGTGGELESDNYYLDSDITLDSSIVVKSGKTVNLCLNGYKLDANGGTFSVISVDTNGTLNICDCKETGKITGGHGDPIMGTYFGGGIYNTGTVNFYSGSITENSVTGAGSGVMNSGTMTMYGGAITDNTITTNNSSGGAVYNTGTFTMLGGSITDNTNTAGLCAGLLHNNGTMTLSGNVQISGNTAVNDIPSNLFIGNPETPVTIVSALSNVIGISYPTGAPSNYMKLLKGTGSYTLSATDLEKFSFDDTNCGRVMRLDSDNIVRLASPITKADATNGSFTFQANGHEILSAVKEEVVHVIPTAATGYELDTISVYKTGDSNTAVTVTDKRFTMPDYGVTVNVTFKVSSTPTYTISGTIKGSDTSAGIPASLQLKNSSGNVGDVVTAAADGSYSITDVPAGSYTIAVSCAGYDNGTITEVTVSNAAITGANLTLTKSSTGLTGAQKLAEEKAAIMAAINRMSFSNSTTAADILSAAQAASLYGVTVAWDASNGFTKTQATASAKGSIRGTLKLTLNQASDGIGIDATIAKLSTGGDNGGGSSNGGGSTTPPSTKPTEPVTGSTENKATVDNKGNASVSLTDKNITDAIVDAKAEAAKKGVNAGDITAVIHVITGGKNADTVTVNLPKTTQEKVIGNKIASVQLVIDRPDLTIGIDLAAVTEINRQAKTDVQLSATRMDNTKLSGDAKAAIGNRPAYDLKALYGSRKSVTDFGKGIISVEIPYTLQKGEIAGNIYAVYVDANGKVTYLTDSSYDAKRGTVVFSTNHFSTYGVAYKASFNFTDIDGHWAKDDILFVANRGLMTGTSSTTFNPNGSMTRGMFVTALGRLADVDISTYKQSSFTDVKADAYYMGYIEWGVKNNILVGVGGGKFDPDGLVTREQMAVIMDRYATAIGFKLPEVHTQNVFADNAKIGAWAAPSVKCVQMASIIQGKSNNLYDPQGTATRAEVSAVLRRFVELAIFSDTAQGWTMNDSGKWMYYENGKPVTGKKDIDGSTYTFDQYGVTSDVPKNLRYTTYTVQKGDSFWSIARKLDCTMSELERLNNKSRFSIIHPGEVLRVPEK